MVVPGIALGWIWARSFSVGWRRASRQVLAGGAAMVLVGGAWPLLVTLTPAADRPWISGTSDNSVWSLIFGYNGLGRVAGQTGGPAGAGGAGSLFGGPTGPFRLLESGLGDQAGWLLGFALVAGVALLAVTRLRRPDPRTGWLLVIGGAFITTAVVFSFARGIFHPYYVSMLAPFAAALIGAGVGEMLPAAGRRGRLVAPLALGAGAATELAVLDGLGGQLSWAKPLVIVVGLGGAVLLALMLAPRLRLVLIAAALAALFAAPATWAAETLGHETSGTFPAGGAASTAIGSPGGFVGGGGPGGFAGGGAPPGAGPGAAPGGGFGAPPGATRGGFARPGGSFGGGGFGGGFGSDTVTLSAAIRYADSHGGGTIGVESQSSAAAAILSSDANVAGLGGFSGRESSVTAAWIAMEVRSGRLRWVIADQQGQSARLPGDTRSGSQAAFAILARTCRAVRITGGTRNVTMYDCMGRSAAIIAASTHGNA